MTQWVIRRSKLTPGLSLPRDVVKVEVTDDGIVDPEYKVV